jgi:OOP family OmpA-OmpF porin
MRKIAFARALATVAVAASLPGPAIADDAASTCNSGPYIVFFDWDKSDITPEAATILDSTINAYGDCKNAPIMLAGHSDRSGSDEYNTALSMRRNESVQAYLTGHGVPAGAVTSQAFGESMPRVPTADDAREAQNRRVEITYGRGPGS